MVIVPVSAVNVTDKRPSEFARKFVALQSKGVSVRGSGMACSWTPSAFRMKGLRFESLSGLCDDHRRDAGPRELPGQSDRCRRDHVFLCDLSMFS